MDTLAESLVEQVSVDLPTCSPGVVPRVVAKLARRQVHNSPWTDEREELLKQLWADGLSAGQIAAELNCGLTRNAVIGKVHRLGLTGRKVQTNNAPKSRKRRASGDPNRARKMRQAAARELQCEPLPTELEFIIPQEQRKTLLQLEAGTCRWPIGDPGTRDFYFCGGNKVEHLPYCAYHSRVAYQPVPDRRRPAKTHTTVKINTFGDPVVVR